MHPDDQTPAAHLPAPLPSPAVLLHRTQAALELLRDVVQESSAEYWYERGKENIKKEQWTEAEYCLNKCISLADNHWRGLLQLAALLSQRKADSKQILIKAFDISITAIDDFGDELLSVQWESVQRGLLQQYGVDKYFTSLPRSVYNHAFKNLDLLLSITITHLVLGNNYTHWNNEYGEAEENLTIVRYTVNDQTIRDREKTYAHLWHRLSGLLYLQNSDYSQAIRDFNIAIQLVNIDFMALYHRADTNYSLENYEASLTDYNRAIDLYPNEPLLHLRRGEVKEKLNQYHAALTDYEHTAKIAFINNYMPIYEAAASSLFDLREEIEDYKGALSICEQILGIDSISKSAARHWHFLRQSIKSKIQSQNN